MFLNLQKEEIDKYIYRIISLDRLIELFKTKTNILVKPRKWEDPYENFILRSKVKLSSGRIVEYNYHDRFYGQCWTLHRASDAMWRIYSPKSNGIRIRTTIKKLLESLYSSQTHLPEVKCYLGKVLYLSEKKLKTYANNIFDDSGVAVDNLFKSLLVKRLAFKHENEIRLLYFEMENNDYNEEIFAYAIDPHSLVSQIMLDPRMLITEAKDLKSSIRKRTGYKGIIKRSLLYTFKNDMVLDVQNA